MKLNSLFMLSKISKLQTWKNVGLYGLEDLASSKYITIYSTYPNLKPT